ncbi:efflux RND transporter periplasmic adaptor subunit [Vibrio tapetis]|uniref:Membrane-fusion protein-like protein n=1 Tax=Vibrio tapetis subsp. tapetis TaxID=1671868 RepID=A0A2N8ZKF9_9VIBR|nr:efflux RND transporter periplasmic adaptor subunit [Vibrio tapetis]SON52382.1 Membrane-fusion protein-like protein [Vibrio tapetis subsp. tapetis]
MAKTHLIALLCAVPALSMAATEVSVINAQYQPVFQSKTYSTSLIASQHIAVISQTSGAITHKMVRNGQHVQKGEVLIKLDDRDYQLNLQEALANLDLAKAAYNQADNDRKGAETLIKKGGMSQSKHDSVLTIFHQAKATMKLAKVHAERAALALERTNIRAKSTGKVIDLYLDQGQHVQAGSPVCDIINDNNIDAIVELPSNDHFITHIEDLSAELAVASAHYQESGKLFAIDGAIDPTKSTLRVRYRFENSGALLDGQFGKVTLKNINGHGNIVIPQSAVLTDRQGRYVLTVEEGVVAQKRVQSIGQHKKDELVRGLEVNDQVIISGTMKLYPGLEVDVKPAADRS